MSIPIGATLEEGTWIDVPTYYFEPNNGDVGSIVSNFSTFGLGAASIETEAVAIPRVGAAVIPYNMIEVLSMFGELT